VRARHRRDASIDRATLLVFVTVAEALEHDDNDTLARVLEVVRRHGWNATSFQALEPGYSYFFRGDGCVAYVETARARVVAGAPIAATDELAAIAKAFVVDARAHGKRCCFVATEDRFREQTADELRSLLLGHQPVWDPRKWPAQLAARKSLREQLRRARAKGVVIREVSASELESGPVREAVERIARQWLATRELPPLGFLVALEPFTFVHERRSFVAEHDGQVVAFAAVVPVPSRSGWFIEDLVRTPNAPNGTTESLVDFVMRWAADSGSEFVTLGLAPLSGDVNAWLRFVREHGSFVYDFAGLHAFKAKLGPDTWAPIHLSYPRSQGTLATLLDVLAAFAHGRALRYLARTLLRGPLAAIRLLAFLLVVWTIALAFVPVTPWFSGAIEKWSWVAFDAVLAAALLATLRRPSPSALAVVAAAVSADAVVTLALAVARGGEIVHDVAHGTIVVLACAAPILASVMLWGARARTAKIA
jgi:phosphatidylglycerol lysyltransferase